MFKKILLSLITLILISFTNSLFAATWTDSGLKKGTAEEVVKEANNQESVKKAKEAESAAESTSSQPKVNCIGLPGCVDKEISKPSAPSKTKNLGSEIINNVIGNLIQFVAVIAVIALILSGIMYLISGGDEEKAKKAKSWIIWALVGVILSVSAWGIIGILNKITIS